MKKLSCLLAFLGLYAGLVQANEPILLPSNSENLSLSIYNNDLALVKDTRSARVLNGINEIIFDGVARNIQPETAIIYGPQIRVLEQNYSYNLMSEENLTEQAIGQVLQTVRQNPQTGENIFETAKLIGVVNGRAILRFDYGIDPSFPGRIIFQQIPSNLSNKPILTAKIKSEQSADKLLNLAYLTSGISWKTDYVANVTGNDRLDLTGLVTINNESGIDYNNAKIQLVAGKVNNERFAAAKPRLMAFAVKGVMNSAALDEESVMPEQISSYELYTLPDITSIKDQQTKQINFIVKKDVKYSKTFELKSPLSVSYNYKFEKVHPQITYVILNTEKDNLGISLPMGIIRFYEKDKNGNLQFIGSNTISNTPKEETLRLNLGEAFNISVNGRIAEVSQKELSRTPSKKCNYIKELHTYEANIDFINSEKDDNVVIFKQTLPSDAKIAKESLKSTTDDARTRVWNVKIDGQGKATLSFTIDVTEAKNLCD